MKKWFLKVIARYLYRRWFSLSSSYSCGSTLAGYINPEVERRWRRFEKVMHRLKEQRVTDNTKFYKHIKGERMRPKVICLCGSTRFTSEMLVIQWELTKQGNIVLSWCALPDSYFEGKDKTHVGEQEGVKEIADEVHKRKIDLADEVFVLNIDGYIGESTRSEIEYAELHGKSIRYLERLKEEE